jgi:hypothetical protein
MSRNYNEASNPTFQLREVDWVEIISLMDNSADFLSTIAREEVQQARKWVKERMGKKAFSSAHS